MNRVTESVAIAYDDFGGFTINENQLTEIVEEGVLAEIAGGLLDAGCRGNAVCGNLVNVIGCINVACDFNTRDLACIANSVCV